MIRATIQISIEFKKRAVVFHDSPFFKLYCAFTAGNRRLIFFMLAYDFFHPNHIVPVPELIAAFLKFPHLRKADMAVKIGAVFC